VVALALPELGRLAADAQVGVAGGECGRVREGRLKWLVVGASLLEGGDQNREEEEVGDDHEDSHGDGRYPVAVLAARRGRVLGGVAGRVDVRRVNLAVEHEVRLQEYLFDQRPLELLVRELDRLAGQAEAHEHYEQDDYEVEQVDQLCGREDMNWSNVLE